VLSNAAASCFYPWSSCTTFCWNDKAGETVMRQQTTGRPTSLLTIKAAADRLGCSIAHVYRLIAAGHLRAADIAPPGSGRTKTRVRDDDLTEYIEKATRERRIPPRDAA